MANTESQKINRPRLRVFMPLPVGEEGKKKWLAVGACWQNRDDSLNFTLDKRNKGELTEDLETLNMTFLEAIEEHGLQLRVPLAPKTA